MNPVSPAQDVPPQVACPQCGTGNPAHNKFCRHCGALMSQPSVKVHVSEPANGEGDRALETPVAVSHPEHVDIHLREGVPAEVEALVSSRMLELENRLAERVDMLDRQLADLQMDQVKVSRPWYRQMPVVIALGALFFTGAATIFNYVQTTQNNAHNARIELRDLTQRLSQIPIDNISAAKAYTNSFQLAQISGLLQEENSVLARQAEEVMIEIPDSVSSSEYILVAQALANSTLYDDALNVVNKATGVIQDANDGSTVYRFKGQLLFNTGNLADGRQAFQQALDIFNKYPTKNVYYQTTTTVQNEFIWATAEYGVGQCTEAKKHIDRAAQLLKDLSPQMRQQANTQQLQAEVQQETFYINACSAP
jgi:tetratricopeptide (TPR) repeat protein